MDSNRLHIKNLSRWIGVATVFCGLLVIVSWYEHWLRILQLMPNTAPMQVNTALCFIVSGAALFLLNTSYTKSVPYLGGLLAIFTTLTLLEYIFDRSLGIDVLFLRPYFEAATAYPGRMSPLAATCFILIGLGLVLVGMNRGSPRWLAVAGLFMSVVIVIAFVALIGFFFGIESAYGWGAYSSMAVNTAVLFLLLGIGLLLSAMQMAKERTYNFVHWLPTTASITLMTMVAFVATGDVKGLNAATFWRKHTIQTILAAQSYENDLIDLQRGMRAYITTGDTNGLATFRGASQVERQRLNELIKITSDNQTQQETLKNLALAMDALFAYDNQLIGIYERQGSQSAFKVDAAGQGRTIFGRAHDLLKEFSQTEEKLLNLRDASEEVSYRNTERLLVVSCALAACLLVAANLIASRELAKRRLAEARLQARAQALRQSNAELQQFAYVASHDMREPLRGVSGFAQILKRRCQDKLDAKEHETIDRIIEGAKRLANIIDDLLALSSISSQRKPFERTPLEKPLLLAMENLSVAIRERGGVIHHDPLPTLPVDASQLMLLFQNLIGNGIKFCAGRTPEIKIGASRETVGVWRISVQDNGIGIEPKHFDKIFGIFQRLHARQQYPGTGIGLAICKKIIERHGGRIWLESTPGAGTTFYFTLAEQQPEKYES